MTEDRLLENLRKGDEQAFKLLVDKYHRMVFSACYAILHNSEDADDIAQEVFIEIFRSLHLFKGEAKLSTWIYRIAINKSLNLVRKIRYRKLLRPLETILGIEMSVRNRESASDKVESSEQTSLLYSAIDSLPENQRTAFLLNKYEMLTHEEIAEVMDTTISGVESLLHRAKANLRKKLINYYKLK